MGYMDRQYCREGASERWTLHGGSAVKILVVVNLIFFLVQLFTSSPQRGQAGWFTDWFAMNPEKVFHEFQLWRLLTGAFLHSTADAWHLILNMLVLWYFGTPVEELYGKKEFLAFYAAMAVLSSLIFGVAELLAQEGNFDGRLPGASMRTMIGASGAVFAVTVLCACHYPYNTVLFAFILPMPLWVLVAIFIFADFILLMQGTDGGVAVAAHLGGAAMGFLYYKANFRFLRLWDSVRRLFRSPGPRSSTSLRLYRPPAGEDQPAPEPVAPRRSLNEQLEGQVDAILAKLAQHNMDMNMLTEEERQTLSRASELLRRRRS